MFLTKWVLRLTIIWLAQLEVVLNCNLNLCRSLEREIRLKHEASTWIRYVQQRSKPWNVFCIQALEPNSYGHRREIFIEKVFIVLHGYLTNFLKNNDNQIVLENRTDFCYLKTICIITENQLQLCSPIYWYSKNVP